MPTLRLTWTRSDVNNPWPGAEGVSTNIIAESAGRDATTQALTDYQISHTVSESANGLTKVVEYSGLSADIQDFISATEPHLNSNFDNTESLFNIQLAIDLIPD